MSVIEALLDLQEVDGRIKDLERELADLPRRRAQELARLNGVSADLKAAQATLASYEARVKSFEDEEKELRQKIVSLKTAQVGLKSNKEYTQFSIQIDMVEHDAEAAKNNSIAAMDDLPKAEADVAAVQQRFDEQKVAVDKNCAELDERIAAVKAELDAAQAERAEKSKAVGDPQFTLYYERLRTKRWPVVSVLTGEGVCDGCHLQQPPSVAQLVDQNAKNAAEGKKMRIIACNMCGRMLYRD